MRKVKLFTIGILTILAIPATAQKKAKSFVEIQPVIGLDKNSEASLQLSAGSTWKVHDMISLGLGAGVQTSFKFGSARFRVGNVSHNFSLNPF